MKAGPAWAAPPNLDLHAISTISCSSAFPNMKRILYIWDKSQWYSGSERDQLTTKVMTQLRDRDCFVLWERRLGHIFFLYIGHILTGSHFVPLQCHTWEVVLHLSCGFSFFLEIRVSKTATLLFCDLKYCLQWKQNRAMKARSQLWRCPLDRHNSWCHHMMPVV